MWEPLQDAVAEGRVTLAAIASFSSLPERSNSWIVASYARWERKRYLTAENLLQDIDVAAKSSEEVLSLSPHEVEQLTPALISRRIDVLLVTPEAAQAVPEKVGVSVWRVQFGANQHGDSTTGLWEVVERSLSTTSLVEVSPTCGCGLILETIVGRTDPRSWIRNQLALVAKASDLLRRWLPPETSRPQPVGASYKINAHPQGDSGFELGITVLTLLARFGKHAGTTALRVGQWQIAVSDSQDFRNLGDPKILTPPADRFWCDPFLLIRRGMLHMFVEEYLYESAKGRIAVLTQSATGEWSDAKTVLERPYHLSYPFVFEHEGELFMLPETTAAGRVELYRCVQFPDKWEIDTVLLDRFAGADATLWFQDNSWWMFVDLRDELHIYYSESPRGPWIPHRRNPVKSDSRNSRPAGRIFRNGADVIRPAQDCSIQYGHEVVFNKVTRLSASEFEEVEIGRLKTPWNNQTSCHTLNQLEGVTVADRLVQRRRW